MILIFHEIIVIDKTSLCIVETLSSIPIRD